MQKLTFTQREVNRMYRAISAEELERAAARIWCWHNLSKFFTILGGTFAGIGLFLILFSLFLPSASLPRPFQHRMFDVGYRSRSGYDGYFIDRGWNPDVIRASELAAKGHTTHLSFIQMANLESDLRFIQAHRYHLRVVNEKYQPITRKTFLRLEYRLSLPLPKPFWSPSVLQYQRQRLAIQEGDDEEIYGFQSAGGFLLLSGMAGVIFGYRKEKKVRLATDRMTSLYHVLSGKGD